MAYEIAQTCMLIDIGLTRSECASWVQAWGSIGAIFMAAWAVHWAHTKQVAQREQEQRVEHTRFLETLFQLLGGARQIADKIEDLEAGTGSSPDDRRTMLAELSALSDALRRIDVNRLDRFDFVESWLVGDGLTRKLIDAIEIVDMPDKMQVSERFNLRHFAAGMVDTLDVRGKRIYDAIEERGGPPGATPMPKNWAVRTKVETQ